MYTVVRKHEIHCGHRVVGHEGKCKNLHGHSYVFEFHCQAEDLDCLGRVIDFSVIKGELCEWLEDQWDHRMLIWEEDPLLPSLRKLDRYIVSVDFNPTAENLGEYLLKSVAPKLLDRHKIVCSKVIVHETGKCRAEVSL